MMDDHRPDAVDPVAGVRRSRETATPPASDRLVDQHGRAFDYLRVAVTDQCNLRCVYCMPEEGVDFAPPEHLLSNDEIVRVVRAVAALGVRKIRFTGGEPLVRKDIVDVVARTVGAAGISDVHLTTNGILLPRHAAALRDAGLHGVNVSLDTLDPERFRTITRRTGLEKVLASIHEAVALGFPSVKINVVAMRGFNDDELGSFTALTRELPVTVRFIELMPFDAHQIWRTGKFLHADWIVARLRDEFPEMQADSGSLTEEHVFRIRGYAGKVAVIPSYSRSLCGGCNRIRLTADGVIRNCLYGEDEFDVRTPLRNGGGDEEIADVFRRAMWLKHRDGWEAQRAGQPAGAQAPAAARDSDPVPDQGTASDGALPADAAATHHAVDTGTIVPVRISMTQIGG